MARFFTALHLASALHLQSDKCKQRRLLQLLLVVFCTHLQGYILVNDWARCRGDENLTPSKTKLSPALGLIFQGSQDVSAFLGGCVWAPVCVCACWGEGARHRGAAQEYGNALCISPLSEPEHGEREAGRPGRCVVAVTGLVQAAHFLLRGSP